jgi:serine/threonine-protein kinase RsbW
MSDWFRRFAAEAGVPAGKALDVELCLNEILTNINHYAHEGSAESRQTQVTLEFQGGRLVATIEDDGKPFNPVETPAPPIPETLSDSKIGGWGIPIVRALTDEVHYERRDGRNRLVLAVSAAGNKTR